MTTRRDDPLAVLEHAPWLESLARGLVADPGLAEDLAQETRILAWSHRPDAERPLRGWLATVMRNLLRQHRRSESRRATRDRLAMTAAKEDSAEVLAARLEAHREVIDAVASLEEPYRSTILLRYFEGKSPSEIAAQATLSVATVKTRLQRALVLLREKLDRSHGCDGRSWKLALVPLVRVPDLPPAALLGVLAVNLKFLAIACAVLLGAGVLFFTGTNSGSSDSGSRVAERSELARVSQPPVLDRSASERREVEPERAVPVAAPSVPSPSTPQPVAASTDRIRGEVIDGEGRPVEGIELIVDTFSADDRAEGRTEGSRVVSGVGGRFEFDAPDRWKQVTASGEGWTTIYPGTRTLGNPDLTVVVSRAIACSGVVVDDNNVPLSGVEVEYLLPAGFRSRFERVLDSAGEFIRVATTADDGSFDLDFPPRIEGATIRAERVGFETATIDAPGNDTADLRVVLTRPGLATDRIEGVVLDPFGAPASDAIVSFRGETTTTDASGRFSIAVGDEEWIDRLAAELRAPQDRVADRLVAMGFGAASPYGSKIVAAKVGFLPAVLIGTTDSDGPHFPAQVVLQLGAQPLTIEGRVVTPDGEPCSGARVWIADPDLLGLVAGGTPAIVENLIVGAAPDDWRFVTTDDDGEFELDGLMPRPYRVVAMDSNLLRVFASGVPAGSRGVELRFPADGIHPSIRGRVVTLGGSPVGRARVVLRNDAFAVSGRTNHGSGASIVTDSEGRFEFKNVPREGVYLRVDGEGILPAEFGRDLSRIDELVDEAGRSAAILEVELRVSARCHMQVQLAAAGEADRFAVVDSAGAAVSIELFSGSRRTTQPRFALVDGKSPVVAVREDAAAVVLYRGEHEVRRIPIQLVVGKVNEVGP